MAYEIEISKAKFEYFVMAKSPSPKYEDFMIRLNNAKANSIMRVFKNDLGFMADNIKIVNRQLLILSPEEDE